MAAIISNRPMGFKRVLHKEKEIPLSPPNYVLSCDDGRSTISRSVQIVRNIYVIRIKIIIFLSDFFFFYQEQLLGLRPAATRTGVRS